MKRAGQVLFFLVCVLFTITAVYNVMSDNAEVLALASASACRGEASTCRAQMTSMERTPFGQTFELATPKRKVEVRCVRALVLVGDYACTLR